MYKQKNKTRLGKSNQILNWLKRRVILITTAIMLGMSNAIYEDDKTIYGSQYHTEQQDKKD